jgi:putative photosynthetic complex assembly protein 2
VTLCIPALLFVLLLWWGSTGVVMYLDGLPRGTFSWSVGLATLLLAAALLGIGIAGVYPTARGAYLGFSCALVAWAWIELTFYTGAITGPRRMPCPPGCGGARRFLHALNASLYHELAIALVLGGVALVTWGAPNRFALWTLLVLAWMHESARLNVLWGVRNLNEEFIPEHLAWLRSYMRRAPMNRFFPFSVTVSTVGAVLLVLRALASHTAFGATGFTLLSALMILAILEHWLLILPIPVAPLWRWALRSRAGGRATRGIRFAQAPAPPLPLPLPNTTP